MRILQTTMAAAFAALFITSLPAGARCISKPGQTALRYGAKAPAALALKSRLPVFPAESGANPAAEASIVGFWYTRILIEGQLVDDGFDMWLSDGTEILNDTSAPSSGAVCMGVWTKTAPLTYQLKHPAWIFDDAGVNLIGVVIFSEKVFLDPNGNKFSGTVSINAYDLSGNVLEAAQFDLTGERMTALDDGPAGGGIPGLPKSILSR